MWFAGEGGSEVMLLEERVRCWDFEREGRRHLGSALERASERALAERAGEEPARRT